MSVKLLGLKVVASRQIFCRQKTAGTAAVGEIINSCERGAWVTVQWQTTGEKQNYYKDENGLFALKILSSESVQVDIAQDIYTCDLCLANPLKGTRWTCTRCLHFDLCTKCYCCGLDHQDHKFERFVTDTADGVIVEARSSSISEKLEGYLSGSTVQRLRGDGEFQIIENAVITEVKKVNWNDGDQTPKIDVVVTWDTGRNEEMTISDPEELSHCRVDHGWICYRDHLPVLGQHVEQVLADKSASMEREIKRMYSSRQALVKVRSTRLELPVLILEQENLELLNSTASMWKQFDGLSVDSSSFLENTLGKEIGNFTHLKYLSLNKCKLVNLPDDIGNLKTLQVILIDGNRLKRLPDTFGELVNLIGVSVCDNELKSLPKSFSHLANLMIFYADNNRFMVFPDVLYSLPKLTRITLSNNRIRMLMPTICEVQKLEELVLKGNEIQYLPPELCKLTELTKLDVARNPLQHPPLRYCTTFLEVREYFDSLQGSEGVYMRRKKVIVLGLTGAGKTSLIRAVVDYVPTNPRIESIRTIGVDERVWRSNIQNSDIPLDVYFLDFGGHDVYYRMYSFFLSDDFVILTVNGRDYKVGCEESFMTHVGHWVQRIQSCSPDALVMMVLTHTDCFHNVQEKVEDIRKQLEALEEKRQSILKNEIAQANFQKSLSLAKSKERCDSDISTVIKRLTTLKEKRFQLVHNKIYCVSNVRLDAINSVAVDLLSMCENSLPAQLIPVAWQKVLEVVVEERTSSECPLMKLSDLQEKATKRMSQIDSIKPTLISQSGSNHVASALKYCHRMGDVLHYFQVPKLKDYVCIYPQQMMQVFKTILRHDMVETLAFNNDMKQFMSQQVFKLEKKLLQEKGLMGCKLFKALCIPNVSIQGDVCILMTMLENFSIAYPINNFQKLLLPWLLPKECPPAVVLKNPCARSYELSLSFNFPVIYPDGFFEKLAVSCHSFYGGYEQHWRKGFCYKLDSRDEKKQSYLLVIEDKNNICEDGNELEMVTLKVVARVSALELQKSNKNSPMPESVEKVMWALAEPVLYNTEKLLLMTPGVVVERFITCPQCFDIDKNNCFYYDCTFLSKQRNEGHNCDNGHSFRNSFPQFYVRRGFGLPAVPTTQQKCHNEQEQHQACCTSDKMFLEILDVLMDKFGHS